MRRLPRIPFRAAAALALCALVLSAGSAGALEARSDLLAGDYDGTLDSVDTINYVVGAGIFYEAGYFGQSTVVANVEGGHVWSGHEVFDRSDFSLPSSPSLLVNAARDPETAPELGDVDFHATMVGHVLAGTGSAGGGNLSLLGVGMAPFATLWSGAIATRFDHSEENLGSFEATKESFLVPYRAFFEGTLGGKADVINSSWGYSDTSGTEEFTRILDALCAGNASVAFVRSAGNGGADAVPGVGFNGIVVGSVGGSGWLTPSEFSSSAAADFYNPATGETVSGVRAAVSIAAPGEDYALAAYLGATGSLAELVDGGDLSTDLYFTFNQSGTSFSSPVVAGGIALLKDVSNSAAYFADQDEARDTRVIKSVLQAGAARTDGWDNGQHLDEAGVLVTAQALDYGTGAGSLDLEAALEVYIAGTTDVPGESGGGIASAGWDYASVALGEANDYFFDLAFDGETRLTVSLNWFVDDVFDSGTETALYGRFANLDLEVWSMANGAFDRLVAQSATLYNNTEFLRFDVDGGSYGLRVTYGGLVYDLLGTAAAETYGLAWLAVAVPEPWQWSLGAILVVLAAARRKVWVARHRGMR